MSDGTEAGTTLVHEGFEVGLGNFLGVWTGHALFFTACNPPSATCELWRSDGTGAGTSRVQEQISDRGIAVLGDAVLYTTDDTALRSSVLWRTDGSEAGTSMLASWTFGRDTLDFNHDGRRDVAVYDPPSGLFFSTTSWSALPPNGLPVYVNPFGFLSPRAYEPSSGRWWSAINRGDVYGGPGYIPVPGDYRGDGRRWIAVYHQETGLWYVPGYVTGSETIVQAYGGAGYEPVPQDYDGDRIDDFAVYHRPTGLWYVRASTTGATTVAGFGGPDYEPALGDFDGDGRADHAVMHGPTGLWFVQSSQTGSVTATGFGGPAYVPVSGDYDGDGKADLAVFHTPTALWYVRSSDTGVVAHVGYGSPDCLPFR